MSEQPEPTEKAETEQQARAEMADPIEGEAVSEDMNSTDSLAQVPVIGIGASAGGLEAIKDLLSATPVDTGACFVFVQHLDPGHKSMLTELLSRCTEMPVRQAEHGMDIEANTVVIIRPNTTLTIHNGALHVEQPAPPRTHRTPIDTFFQSLAADQGDRAIAIVLSGTGSDGTQGLKTVKETGGFTLIQDPRTAKYDSMPRNAEATGLVDQVLSPAEIPACLVEYLEHVRDEAGQGALDQSRREVREEIAKICGLLKVATGHNFRGYKEPTFLRRVQRRMQVLRLASIVEYEKRLRSDPKELRQLFRELLVSVTGFFRDAKAFDALDREVLAKLIERKEDGDAVRVWVAGCATGEEAYSIAMSLKDRIDRSGKSLRVQVFATDIDETALEVARRARYPDSISAYVPEPFTKRFFRVVGGEYQVSEEIRQFCIFSTQSLIKDPPFGRLDLISCRNVLIYLKSELQHRVIPVFHYALRSDAFLFLGPSESLSRHTNLFHIVDKKWRIFQRRETLDRPQIQFPLIELVAGADERKDGGGAESAGKAKREALVSVAERAMLEELGPAFAIITESRELIYTGGRVEPYLQLPRGTPSLEILNMVHESLRMDVRALLHRAITEQNEVVRDNVSIERPDGRHRLRLKCRPLGQDRNAPHNYLVVFYDLGPALADVPFASDGVDATGQVVALETELRTTKEYLQTTTEELESSNEELKSANEELMSMNEELQSSNEELETSKEELQSVNEELETVNAELASKVEELGRSNADLQNLLESTQIATLFLDRGMRVRSFTPVAKEVFHLIESDLGRTISDITARVEDVDLSAEAEQVFRTLAPVERELKVRDGDAIFMMRILPYRTVGEVIDGVVATFVNVTRLKKAQAEIDSLNHRLNSKVNDLQAVLELAPIGIAFADDPACSQIEVNRYGASIMHSPRKARPAGDPAAGYRIMRDGNEMAAEDLPLQVAWRTGQPVKDFRATLVRANGEGFELLMSAAPILDDDGTVRRVVGVYDDVSGLVSAQAAAETRAAQQDFVATIGSRSLRGVTGDELPTMMAKEVARLIGAEFARFLIYQPEQTNFRVSSAFGLEPEDGAVVSADQHSLGGYTLCADAPVIIENMAEEKRFTIDAHLRDAGAKSGIAVVIGDPKHACGVIDAYTRTSHRFSADDIKFLQSVGNVIAATLQRDAWLGHQQLLMNELRHRVKNLLATVQAIASLSFRQKLSSPEIVKSFIARLNALARAHDLQFRSNWKEVAFAELIQRQTEPYDSTGTRIELHGRSDVRLPPELAIDMAMAIHELATNAAKHGALSKQGGKVDVTWRTELRGDEEVIVLDWAESGGPEVESKGGDGVGAKLLDTIAKRSVFQIDRSFERDGLRCRIDIGVNS